VLIACWSPKGGSGTTVVATALGLVLSSGRGGALLADLAGDVPAALGLPEPGGAGLADWLVAGADVPDDALSRLEVEVSPTLGLLPAGRSPSAPGPTALTAAVDSARGEALAAALAGDRRPVVADCGLAAAGPALAVAAAATLSLLVLRPCYLALRRALAAPIKPSGVVLVSEVGRALGRRDVEEVLGVPVRAEVAYDPAVARAVDAGLLAGRVPRILERSLRQAA
jgi:MinD-like ATPase involved in chromosome partitioning or flagellar assembly